MTELLETLIRNKEPSTAKSYLIGVERGKIWAEQHADYYDIREWAEIDIEKIREIELPGSEEIHFKILSDETPLEWADYLKGWLVGVKEILREYKIFS